jgi:hypothetical protein
MLFSGCAPKLYGQTLPDGCVLVSLEESWFESGWSGKWAGEYRSSLVES